MHQVQLESQNFEITESIQNHVEQSLSKVNEQFDSIVSNNIRVYLQSSNHHSHQKGVKIVIPTRITDVVVTEDGDDLYKLIHDASGKAVRALRKQKEKYN